MIQACAYTPTNAHTLTHTLIHTPTQTQMHFGATRLWVPLHWALAASTRTSHTLTQEKQFYRYSCRLRPSLTPSWPVATPTRDVTVSLSASWARPREVRKHMYFQPLVKSEEVEVHPRASQCTVMSLLLGVVRHPSVMLGVIRREKGSE